MMRIARFPLIFLILILSRSERNSTSATTPDKIVESLHKALNYSLRNPDSIGLSGIFGTIRAKALITDVPKNESNPIFFHIERNFDDILAMRGKILEPHDEWVRNISDPNLWIQKISYRHLHNECFLLNRDEIKNLIKELSNEAETACITPEMFQFCLSSYYVRGSEKYPACKFFLLGNYNGIGYETTHRVLFLQILKIWNSSPKNSEKLVESLCKFIYKQAKATEGKYFFFDLFLEQVFLCGVEGYKEFLNLKWLDIILENQLEEGCFATFSTKTKFNSSSIYDEECSDHASGVALATLALHLHFNYNQNQQVF